MKKYFLAAVISIFIIQFTGCTSIQNVQEERVISAERIIKRIEANRRKIKTYVGNGSITVNTKELNTTSNFKVEIKRPDSLKVSFFGPFGIDLAFALVTLKDFQFYDAINNSLYSGKVRPGIIKDVMKIDIPYDELIDAVTGSVNLTNKLRTEPIAKQTGDREYELVYPDSVKNKISKIKIDAESYKILQFTVTDLKGKISYQSDYHDFSKVEDTFLPYTININDIANNQKLKIIYRRVEINNLTEMLKLDVPDDAQINRL